MKLFNSVALEITSQCNRKCPFCPVAYNERPDERMSWSLFEKAVTELKQLQYSGRVELYIYNEPLKDREYFEACLSYLRGQVPKCCIMIATNGDYIRRPEWIRRWYNLGLNQLLINCYSPGLYTRRLKWLTAVGDVEIDGPIYSRISPRRKTIKLLDKSDIDRFGVGVFRLSNRAGNISQFIEATPEPVSRMCVKPFRFFNINWLGQALICCQDYYAEYSLGNLATSTLQELWNCPTMNEYRRHLLRKDRSLPLCNRCDCSAGAYPHNVPHPPKKNPRS